MLDLVLKQAGESEPGFARKTVKWAITCTGDGRFTGVVPLGEGKGRTFDSCPNVSQPELVGGGEPRAHFLVERLDTVALYLDSNTNEKDREKFAAKHDYFVNLLGSAAAEAPYLSAASTLLTDTDALEAIRAELTRLKTKPTESAMVIVDGINPLERDEWREWWRNFRLSLRAPKINSVKMRCLVTGDVIEPATTHPKIKGLAGVGGLGTGDVMVGFDKQAFQSYGLEQSANAAMSEETTTAYTETLNRLIDEKGAKLGNTLTVYWYTESVAVEDDPLAWLKEPSEQTAASAELKAHELLIAIRAGKRADLSNNRYVALLLSGQAGRVMVREVMQGAFEALAANAESWFREVAMVPRDGKGLAPSPKFLTVAGSLVRDLKDLPSPWLQQLWRGAVTGGVIPGAALAPATLRARIDVINDQPASHARMGLIKASTRRHCHATLSQS